MPDLDNSLPALPESSGLRGGVDVAAIARAYGWRRVLASRPVVAGAGRDPVWRVSAVDHAGASVDAALKVLHPATRADDAAGLERCLVDEARAWAAGVAMPELLRPGDGRGYATVPGTSGETTVRVVARRWVASTAVDYGELVEVRRPAAVDVAVALAALHALPAVADPALVDWTESRIDAVVWQDLAELAVASGAGFAQALVTRLGPLNAMGDLIAAAPEPDRGRLTHNDCAPHNGIRPNSGNPRTMLVDWDACSGGSAQREFVATVIRWSDVPGSANRGGLAREMVHAYRERGGQLAPVETTDGAMYLAGMTHWLHNRLELALGINADGRTTSAAAATSVASLLAWIDNRAEMDSIMRVLAAG